MKRETKLWNSIKSHNKFSLCEVWKSHKLKSKFCVSTAWNTFDNELSCQQCGHFHFCATSTAGILRMTNILCKQSKWNWKRSQEGQVTKAPDPLQNKSHHFDTFVKILLFFPFTFNNSLKSGDCGGRMTFFFKIKFLCWFFTQVAFLPNLCPIRREVRGVNSRENEERISFSFGSIVWVSSFFRTRFLGGSERDLFFGNSVGVTFFFFCARSSLSDNSVGVTYRIESEVSFLDRDNSIQILKGPLNHLSDHLETLSHHLSHHLINQNISTQILTT